MMKRRLRLWKIATCISVGAYMLQLGTCLSSGANTLLSSIPFGTILTDAGLSGVCGTPNFVVVDANGIPGDVQFAEDDLVYFCPVTVIYEQNGGNGN